MRASSLFARVAGGLVAASALAAACLPDLEVVPGGSGGAGASGGAGGTPGAGAGGGGGAGASGGAGGDDGGSGGAAGAATGGGGSGGVAPIDCGPQCTCTTGECAFDCPSPPCDANCDNGSTCTAECGDSTCNCQNGSSCQFSCVQPDCNVVCNGGSQCSLDCGALTPQSQDCDIQVCQGGTVMLCADGKTLVCNMPCPT